MLYNDKTMLKFKQWHGAYYLQSIENQKRHEMWFTAHQFLVLH